MKIFFVQFFYVFLPLFLISFVSVRSIPFLSFIEPIFAWNSNLLQEDLCHALCLPGLLLPEPLSPWQATAGPCLHRRQSNTFQRQFWLSLLWRSLLLSLCPGVHEVLLVPSEHLWWVWDLILNILCPCYQIVGASPLSLDAEYLSFVGSNILMSIVVQELVVILVNSMKR